VPENYKTGYRRDYYMARSAWQESQRYPLHWEEMLENTNTANGCNSEGGLSIGLSGFSFWSHDIGGFVNKKT